MAIDGATYRPASSVTSLRTAPVSTFRIVTATSGNPAPVGSRTVPETDAPTTCPEACAMTPSATTIILMSIDIVEYTQGRISLQVGKVVTVTGFPRHENARLLYLIEYQAPGGQLPLHPPAGFPEQRSPRYNPDPHLRSLR